MKNTWLLCAMIISAALPLTIYAQTHENWYEADRSADNPHYISTQSVYKNMLKGKKGHPVIVAVIDSGIDIEHEDLKDVMWQNHDEIPGNGIDDDENGYVDDIYGWNFIGGRDGSQVDGDTFEMTRLYAIYKKKFKNADISKLSSKDKKEYDQYVMWGKKIEKEVASAKKNYEELEEQYNFFVDILEHVKGIRANQVITPVVVDSLSKSFNQMDAITANVFNSINTDLGEYPSNEFLQRELVDAVGEGLKYYGDRFKYNYNPDYNPRTIVGDNYADKNERDYGNNLVEGPDARHGTHVAGIIAASRNNDLGMNGIADNVRIMALRAVPNGDERDKDVANSIYYAVDNGASIINMSFGKGQSPYKQVVDDAVRYAETNDVLIVHAAGNSNEELNKENNFPNDYFAKPKGFLFWKKKQPKNYITIGASGPTDDEHMAASFSNYSRTNVDVFAPGVEIYSTVPDDKYENLQGTSMAAPVVSGVAALIRSFNPSLTAEQVKNILIKSTKPNSKQVFKPGTEELIPFSDLSVSGGIIDVKAALEYASTVKGKKKITKKKDRA